MRAKQVIQKPICAGLIIFLLLGLLPPLTTASITINVDDGIWHDDFKYDSTQEANENLTIQNCTIDTDNGIITLLPETGPRSYDFAEEDFPHIASVYKSFIFRSFWPRPNTIPTFRFDDRDYDGIKAPNDNNFATRSSSFLYKNVVQEFRFQFDVGVDSIGSIEIYWKGETSNTQNVKLYYWTVGSYGYTPRWEELNSSTSGEIEFLDSIDAENASLAVMDDNYFYVCVVASSANAFTTCSISSDYIEISSLAEESWDKGPGIITTNTTIDPNLDDFYWEMLTWNDYEPDQTNIRYHILYDPEGNGNFVPIPDHLEYFDGSNENGFTSSPVFLNKLKTTGSTPITKIRIQANLTSNTDSKTPKLYSWTVTWQKNHSHWKDSFNSSYRIDKKSKVNVVDGSVNISSLQGEWPMFGYNTKNTRSTDGRGPQGSSPPLKWYSSSEQLVGGGYRNPVIGDDSIYIFNTSHGLIKYDIKGDKPNSPDGTIDIQYNTNAVYMNSPITTEEYVIIASGKSGPGGMNNVIRGFNKDFDKSWKFEYTEPISYYSSPVVYDNKLFITTWSGDTKLLFPDYTNNKVIALDLEKIELENSYNNEHEVMLWEYDLPAGSYSTPAVYNDMVFVGCLQSKGESFFVLDANGNGDGTTNVIWSEEVGSIGRSSPVIYDDAAFVTSKVSGKIIITALDIEGNSTNRVLWEKTICSLPLRASADSTPAVYDGVLYVASPRGTIYALDIDNGETLWSNSIYTTLRDYLTSSPVYADGYIYIGTPSGRIYGLNAEENGSIAWEKNTFQSENFAYAPVYSSPIVSNEMLFIADEFGVLYAFGTYEELNKEMEGSITSIPINLPTGNWWGTFSINFTSESGSNIKFSILDKNQDHIKNISDGEALNLASRPNVRTIHLYAYLTAANISVNPTLRWWKITFEEDNIAPEFIKNSFEPDPEGWLNDPTPVCKIDVYDNESGLNLDGATFTITYDTAEKSNEVGNYHPEYTGENGDHYSKLTADISSLDIAENITNLTKIVFKITDYGDNSDTAIFMFKQDTTLPTSTVDDDVNNSQFTSNKVVVNVTAQDAVSGIKSVQLKYRYSDAKVPSFSGNWMIFGDPDTTKPYSWNFTDVKGGGHYELTSIATDKLDNVEDEPESGDVSFIFDNDPPEIPDGLSEEHWFKELPAISIEFSDDFLLDTIKYRPEFETEWTEIDADINQATYDAEWDLPQEYWDQMEDGKQYILHFWINDSLGNTQIIDGDGYKIIKDAAKPNVDLEVPTLETEWSFEDTFTIKAFATDGDGSGIKSVELFYQYSEDDKFDGNWTSYGVLTFEPFEWEFKAEEGNGYYKFKIVVEDLAGNVAESEVFSTGINIFPLFSVVAMVLLIITLIMITIVIFIKWRKK